MLAQCLSRSWSSKTWSRRSRSARLSGFHVEKRSVQAVTGVSFSLDAGQTMGLVGESGSGKTTVGRCVLRLVEPTAGSIKFEGVELMDLDRNELRKIRREMQIVFQDPYASLDPRRTVGAAIAEPFEIQKIGGDHQKRVGELLELVGLAADHAQRFPARVLRWSAAAHRHRPSPGAEPEARHPRRAGVGPRRVDPGRRRQPARRTSRTNSGCRTSSSPTISRSCATSPT